MNCIKCGMEIPDGAKFCSFCGVKQELTCGSCGAVLSNGARFCHMCGNPVSSPLKAKTTEQKPAPKMAAEQKPAPQEEKPVELVSVVWVFGWGGNEVLNKQNFHKLFRTDGHESGAHKCSDGKWELRVELQYGDHYRHNTDPDYHCYGSISIVEQDTGLVVRGLEDLMAYTLSDHGIYYVTQEGRICFVSANGQTQQVLGNQKNVISLDYEAGVLTVTYVKDRRQTGYNKHYDLVGGLSEAWYDIYKLDVGQLTIRHTPG